MRSSEHRLEAIAIRLEASAIRFLCYIVVLLPLNCCFCEHRTALDTRATIIYQVIDLEKKEESRYNMILYNLDYRLFLRSKDSRTHTYLLS